MCIWNLSTHADFHLKTIAAYPDKMSDDPEREADVPAEDLASRVPDRARNLRS
jgi:hypothetical protein